ncbi:MAG: hypothetical protein ACT4N4_10665 [Rhodospirillales bacterium]
MRKTKTGDTLRRVSQSFFVKRGGEIEYVKAGDLFRQRGRPRLSETARVLSLALDGQKIPHVRYNLRFRRGQGVEFDGGSRAMALKPFLKLYSERVPPPRAGGAAAPETAADLAANLAKAAE